MVGRLRCAPLAGKLREGPGGHTRLWRAASLRRGGLTVSPIRPMIASESWFGFFFDA